MTNLFDELIGADPVKDAATTVVDHQALFNAAIASQSTIPLWKRGRVQLTSVTGLAAAAIATVVALASGPAVAPVATGPVGSVPTTPTTSVTTVPTTQTHLGAPPVVTNHLPKLKFETSSSGGAMSAMMICFTCMVGQYTFNADGSLSTAPASASVGILSSDGMLATMEAIFGGTDAWSSTGTATFGGTTYTSNTGDTLDFTPQGEWTFSSASTSGFALPSSTPSPTHENLNAQVQSLISTLNMQYNATAPSFNDTAAVAPTPPSDGTSSSSDGTSGSPVIIGPIDPSATGLSQTTDATTSIDYQVLINGHNVDAVASFTFDDVTGGLLSASAPFISSSSAKDYPTISPTDAVGALNNAATQARTTLTLTSGPSPVTINSADIEWTVISLGDGTNALIPYYRLSGSTGDSNNSVSFSILALSSSDLAVPTNFNQFESGMFNASPYSPARRFLAM